VARGEEIVIARNRRTSRIHFVTPLAEYLPAYWRP
jgi:hypothetical protein